MYLELNVQIRTQTYKLFEYEFIQSLRLDSVFFLTGNPRRRKQRSRLLRSNLPSNGLWRWNVGSGGFDRRLQWWSLERRTDSQDWRNRWNWRYRWAAFHSLLCVSYDTDDTKSALIFFQFLSMSKQTVLIPFSLDCWIGKRRRGSSTEGIGES